MWLSGTGLWPVMATGWEACATLYYLVPKLVLGQWKPSWAETRQGRHEVVFLFTFSPFALFPFSPDVMDLEVES